MTGSPCFHRLVGLCLIKRSSKFVQQIPRWNIEHKDHRREAIPKGRGAIQFCYWPVEWKNWLSPCVSKFHQHWSGIEWKHCSKDLSGSSWARLCRWNYRWAWNVWFSTRRHRGLHLASILSGLDLLSLGLPCLNMMFWYLFLCRSIRCGNNWGICWKSLANIRWIAKSPRPFCLALAKCSSPMTGR